jgi:RNA polymerase sigma factor (sigma-70 family)
LQRLARACGVASDRIDDVVQAVFVELLRRWPSLAGASALPAAWLCRVVQSKAVDAHRRARSHRAADLSAVVAAGQEPVDPQPGPMLALEQQEERQLLYATLEQLRQQFGKKDARVLDLRMVQGQTAAQVAVTLGVSEKNVRVRHCWLLRRLRALVKAKENKGLGCVERGRQGVPGLSPTGIAGKKRKKSLAR